MKNQSQFEALLETKQNLRFVSSSVTEFIQLAKSTQTKYDSSVKSKHSMQIIRRFTFNLYTNEPSTLMLTSHS